MTKWNDRLEEAMYVRGRKWAELPAVTGRSKPAVYAWRRDAKNRTRTLDARIGAKICAWLDIKPRWLFDGKGPSGLEDMAPPSATPEPEEPEEMEGLDVGGKVPVIAWVQAGDYRDVLGWDADDSREYVTSTVRVRDRTFALRVEGNSMEPLFPEGVFVIVEPDMLPDPGDYVIACSDEGGTTLKQLVREGVDWYLRPINRDYKTRPLGDATIVGVVREMVKKFR